MQDKTQEKMLEVYGSTDQPATNVLEPGRYKFQVKQIVRQWQSKKGNPCIEVEFIVGERTIKDTFVTAGKFDYRYRNFLFAIGIRKAVKKGESFTISESEINGKQAMMDVAKVNEIFDDGFEYPTNKVRMYSPIQNDTAAIKGIPVEPESDTGEKWDL